MSIVTPLRQAHLTTVEVAERSGLTFRMLDYYTRNGVITPVQEGAGPGTIRYWSDHQAAVCHVIASLARLGAQSRTLTNVARHLLTLPTGQWPSTAIFDADGHPADHPTSRSQRAWYSVNLALAVDAITHPTDNNEAAV